MAPLNKILSHPMKEDIIKWLTEGVSIRDVATRLAEQFPAKTQTHLRISTTAIQDFKVNHLNLKGKVLQDIKEASALTRQAIRHGAIQAEVENTDAYREKINSIASDQLSAQQEIMKLFTLIESRIEAIYNKQAGADYTDVKLEKLLQTYFEQMLKIVEGYKKFVEGYKDSNETNVNITVMTDQVGIIREAVREVLGELDPAIAVRFMEKINAKMRSLSYRADGMYSNQLIEGDLS